MGTNFYIKIDGDDSIHIGKRSAAGLFCWNCGISLCKGGHDKIHSGRVGFLDCCPICEEKPKQENLSESSAGRELGFNNEKPTRKSGVSTCASFTWAITPEQFLIIMKQPEYSLHIEDEYGRIIDDFSSILSECPIMFWNMIGKEFS